MGRYLAASLAASAEHSVAPLSRPSPLPAVVRLALVYLGPEPIRKGVFEAMIVVPLDEANRLALYVAIPRTSHFRNRRWLIAAALAELGHPSSLREGEVAQGKAL